MKPGVLLLLNNKGKFALRASFSELKPNDVPVMQFRLD